MIACRLLLILTLSMLSGWALAAVEAVTDDGKRVRLLDDHTWEYIDSLAEEIEPVITIEVMSKTERHGNCIYGLKLQNNADYRIISLVPQFAAYLAGDVRFDNQFVSFQDIKPTLSQYQELEFRKVSCQDIARVQVHGGDRCNMDELTKYSPEKGECLRRVRIVPSPLVEISE